LSEAPLYVEIRGRMARRICAMMQLILVFIRRDTARYRTKGYNGSNSHPKAGLSWPMSYPYCMADGWWLVIWHLSACRNPPDVYRKYVYKGTSPIRKHYLLGPYRRPMSRVLGGS